MVFKCLKDLQNMAFNMFNNLRLLMSVRYICSWQHQLLQKIMDIKEAPYGVYFLYGKSNHVDKETALVSVADNILLKLDQQDARKGDCQILQSQSRIILQNILLLRKVCQIC